MTDIYPVTVQKDPYPVRVPTVSSCKKIPAALMRFGSDLLSRDARINVPVNRA